jgi:tetratricopeptide (TPR) repeat protein
VFEAALARLESNHRAGAWDAEACTAIPEEFLKVARTGTLAGPAHFNAAVSFQRCGREAKACDSYRAALAADPALVPARTPVAVCDALDKGPAQIRVALGSLSGAQSASELATRAGLSLMLYAAEANAPAHLRSARQDIEKALAAEPNHPAALNQHVMAILLEVRNVGPQQHAPYPALVEAAAICEHGIRGHASYAPLYLTAGLVALQDKKHGKATVMFDKARTLAPEFAQAHYEFGASSLAARHFEAARSGFAEALRLRPNHYDACLGLTTASRGLLSSPESIAAADKVADACTKLAPERPEAWLNRALLLSRAAALATDAKVALDTLRAAIEAHETFLKKAGSAPAFAQGVNLAREDLDNCKQRVVFVRDTVGESGPLPSPIVPAVAEQPPPPSPSPPPRP